MGLMQLLTVGRSLSEAKDHPHRYKLRTGNWPTFGHGPSMRRSAAMKFEAEEEDREMKTDLEAEKAAKAHVAYPRGRWTQGAPAPGAEVKPGSQGELSLDRVKPVRNDLSDTDLELIPRQEKPKAEPEVANVFAAATTADAPATPAKVSWWARLKSRLFSRKSG